MQEVICNANDKTIETNLKVSLKAVSKDVMKLQQKVSTNHGTLTLDKDKWSVIFIKQTNNVLNVIRLIILGLGISKPHFVAYEHRVLHAYKR